MSCHTVSPASFLISGESSFPDYVRNTTTHEYRDSKMRDYLYSLLLTAQTSGKSVQLYDTGACSGAVTKINGARLVD